MIYEDSDFSFGDDDREALRILVREILKPGCQIVEIGSWLGTGSTKVIIEELKSIGSGTLYCIDTWKGSQNVPHHQETIARYDIFETFLHNIKVAGGEAYVRPLAMSSREAASMIKDSSMDLVFIDGDHSYTAVIEDISLWKTKVREGGILCGHDCECRPNGVLSRDSILLSPDLDHISGVGTPFEVIHPGVILAVDEAFNGSANLWAETPFPRSNGTYGSATIWDNQQLSIITEQSSRPPIHHIKPVPHLIGDLSGYNIVLFKELYYGIPQSLGSFDIDKLDFSSIPQEILIRNSYNEISLAIVSILLKSAIKQQESESPYPNGLIVEGYFGFNIVHHQSCWYGFNQDTGPINIGSLDAESVEAMKKSKQCLTGDSIAEIKANILGLTLQEQQKSANAHCTKIDGELVGLHARIDAAQLQLSTELKSIQERLCAIKEQAEGISHNPLVRVGKQIANFFILKSPNNE